MRALISTYDKTGLDTFARGLVELGWQLVASGSTAAAIEAAGLPVEHVEAVTDFPEMLGGRVKTLHPRIHAGILVRRDIPEDMATLGEHGIETFDLVCVNLYPFAQTVSRPDIRDHEAIEMIDIGGPALLRAAAKNHAWVAPVSSPSQYESILEELKRDSELSPETRLRLAAEAFATTAAYEAAISRWFNVPATFPETLVLPLQKELELAYGENPHQRGAYYVEHAVRSHLLSRVEQLHGKALTFNNLNDLDAARALMREFALPACVIVKHANPCGVAVGANADEAYDKALACDPMSAYGGVVVFNRQVEEFLGAKLAEQFVEVAVLTGLRRRCPRGAATEAGDADPARHGAPPRRPGGPPLQARSRRHARAGPGSRPRGARQLGGRQRDGGRGTMGRARLRLACLQARHVERDRAHEGPRDDRDRGRPDEPCRRGADRGREGQGVRSRHDGLGPRVRRVLSLPRRAADRARRGHDRDRPAGRLAPRRRGDRRGRAAGAAMVFTGRRHFRH